MTSARKWRPLKSSSRLHRLLAGIPAAWPLSILSLCTRTLVAALGRKIEPHEGAHQILYPTGVGRVGVEDLATRVSGKDAGAHLVFAAGRRAVIEDGAAGGDVLLLKNDTPKSKLKSLLCEETHGKVQPKSRLTCSIRSSGAREIAANDRSAPPKCCRAASIMIGDEGAPFADVIVPRRQHEVIDSELAAAPE
jgi:hypothetical protein